ncbi:MAG: NAD(P)H-hydrate dehydratase [Treponema sp.]|jgi:NAD(P)H-hydrate epimerase|nr:NAD(P)H-hydrate dehydratase [Treponema sp.]
MKIVTGKQMLKIERMAIEELGIPSILLMENAALCVAKHCLKILDGKKNPRVMIFCGSGNNGGDGMAAARHLHTKGIDVKIVFAADTNNVKGDPAVYFEIIKELGIPIETALPDPAAVESYDLVVDAIFGTGLDRNIDDKYASIIELINNHAKYIVSVDMPSGVHSGTGQIMGCAVKAAETVTFGYPKTGLYVYPGAGCAGKIHIEDISLPVDLIEKIETDAQILTDEEAARLLPVRKKRSNKGSFGRIVVFAGSNEMPGAAALVSSASYTVGGGLVCACVLHDVAAVVHNWQREVVTRILPGKDGMYFKKSLEIAASEINNCGVIVLGPGIGRSHDVTEFVREIISIAEKPLVLDADALFAVAEDVNILKALKAPCVITPHPGEMSRLTGLTVAGILDNPVEAAVDFAKKFNVVTLLKDAHTIAAHPNGNFFVNTTGSNALSKAGTGDVLAGMIAGFIAQGSSANASTNADVFTAAMLSAYIHGRAGEAASQVMSNYGVTASDVLKFIPQVINTLR